MAWNPQRGAMHAQPMAEINTTPLVDVMLVLLVIFIITAPLFHQAVPVDLPHVDATRLDDKPLVIELAIDGKGQVFVNALPTGMDALQTSLAALTPGNGSKAPELHLRAERSTPYERITAVMAIAQRVGLNHIAFVTGGTQADVQTKTY